MGKTVIIAEKPSVAQDIVRALTPTSGKFEKGSDHFENDQYIVTSAVGHLVEIKAPRPTTSSAASGASPTCRWCRRTSTWRRSTRPSHA
jgi:DNA topoisomerase IA